MQYLFVLFAGHDHGLWWLWCSLGVGPLMVVLVGVDSGGGTMGGGFSWVVRLVVLEPVLLVLLATAAAAARGGCCGGGGGGCSGGGSGRGGSGKRNRRHADFLSWYGTCPYVHMCSPEHDAVPYTTFPFVRQTPAYF